MEEERIMMKELWEKYPPRRYHYMVKLNNFFVKHSTWKYFGDITISGQDYYIDGNIVLVYIRI